jgi:hypothetical protein
MRKAQHRGEHQYEATDRPGAQNPLIPDRPVAVLPADFGEARRVDRACISQETKAQEVKPEKSSVPPASVAYGKIIVDQSDKIHGLSDKKKKPGKPDHTEAGGKISHFRPRFFGLLALVSLVVANASPFRQGDKNTMGKPSFMPLSGKTQPDCHPKRHRL